MVKACEKRAVFKINENDTFRIRKNIIHIFVKHNKVRVFRECDIYKTERIAENSEEKLCNQVL